jgi:hypothetical protein
MKSILTFLFCIIGFIFSSGCSKEDTATAINNTVGSASITLNGGGLNSKTYNFTGFAGAYLASQNVTTATASTTDGSDNVQFIIAFPGQATGIFNWVGGNQASGVVVNYLNSQKSILGYSGSTTVTSYGSVGGQIVGTFSGSVIRTVISPLSIDTLSASGSFSILRLSNQ